MVGSHARDTLLALGLAFVVLLSLKYSGAITPVSAAGQAPVFNVSALADTLVVVFAILAAIVIGIVILAFLVRRISTMPSNARSI